MRGWTAIELLVVVVIIAILTAVALPRFQVVIQQVRYRSLQEKARQIVRAEKLYFATHGRYTGNLKDLEDVTPPAKPPIYEHYLDSNSYYDTEDEFLVLGLLDQYVEIRLGHHKLPADFVQNLWFDPSVQEYMHQPTLLVSTCEYWEENRVAGARLCKALGARKHATEEGWWIFDKKE